MGVADEGRVVPPGECPMQGRADAPISLCADDDQSPDTEAGQHGLKGGVLEGVAVVLLDQRLCVARSQLAAFCTSTTRSAVFGRFSSVAMVSACSSQIRHSFQELTITNLHGEAT
jgi:hypothetical protein